MSTVHLMKCLLATLAGLVASSLSAHALELKGFKDDLFAYPAIIERADDGAYLKVDYNEMRDINGRDQIPERRAKGNYVSLGVRWKQSFEKEQLAGRTIDVFRAGRLEDAKFAVIFIHGRGGDRKLGANDFTFGGNFNRLKNLAIDNGGVYLAPSVRDFGQSGAADISALIGHVRQQAPRARIVLSCASMGSFICWQIVEDPAAVGALSGMMIMGGATDHDYAKTAAFKARLPLFFSHGSRDSVYAAADQIAAFRSLRGEGYPTRFVLFETGSHGTPVRMTDWKDSLDWIFAQRP